MASPLSWTLKDESPAVGSRTKAFPSVPFPASWLYLPMLLSTFSPYSLTQQPLETFPSLILLFPKPESSSWLINSIV
jgi:hypothetical protein